MQDVRPTYYEFFAGGGMVSQALGDEWSCLFANDFSAKKAAAYKANWGDEHLMVGDIQSVTLSDLPGVADLAWGSSPCQDVSLAGKGQGLSGGRSGMFWAFHRLICGLQDQGRCPQIVALENVTGLVTSNKGADFQAVCQAFNARGFRFGAMIVDAVRWLPQSRPRFFMIAIAPGVKIPSEIMADGPSIEWHSKALIRGVENLTPEMRKSWIWWKMEAPAPRSLDLVDILEEDTSALGWHSAEETNRLLGMMSAGHREKVELEIERSKQTGQPFAAGLYKRTREGIVRAEIRVDGVAGCLRTPGGGSSRQTVLVIEDGRVRSRLLSAREAARLMGLPDSYRLPERYNDAYHLAGDGVAVPVVEALRRGVFEPVLGANAAKSRNAA